MSKETFVAEATAQGEWVKDRDTHKCSKCGFGLFMDQSTYFMDGVCIHIGAGAYTLSFCPNCGLPMTRASAKKDEEGR